MTKFLCFAALALIGCDNTPFALFGRSPIEDDAGAVVDNDAGAIGRFDDDAGRDAAPPFGAGGTGGASGTGGAHASGGTGGTSMGGAVNAGGAIGVGGTDVCSTPITHDNGTGQTWQDCVPAGTYNEDQAMKACHASFATMCTVEYGCGATNLVVCGYTPNGEDCVGGCWGYDGSVKGYVSSVALGGCSSCPTPGGSRTTTSWQ